MTADKQPGPPADARSWLAGMHLKPAQRLVLAAAVAYHDRTGQPIPPKQAAIATKFTLVYATAVLDQLVVLGLGSRPVPTGTRETRPFTPAPELLLGVSE